jgi:hypothetical protein
MEAVHNILSLRSAHYQCTVTRAKTESMKQLSKYLVDVRPPQVRRERHVKTAF